MGGEPGDHLVVVQKASGSAVMVPQHVVEIYLVIDASRSSMDDEFFALNCRKSLLEE